MSKTTPAFGQWYEDQLAEGKIAPIQHGDYQRLANLTNKRDGRNFTADYVRKVLLGLRRNAQIERKAKQYLRQQAKVLKALS